ncbi:MAG: hypothetical protein ACRCTG_11055 [Aestuariivirga sp.]
MMAQTADAFIGIRVSGKIKKAWTAKARREHRSLSNWIVQKLEAQEEPPQPSQDAPRKA